MRHHEQEIPRLHRSLRETPRSRSAVMASGSSTRNGREVPLIVPAAAAVSCLGHQHPRVLEAMAQQAGKLTYAHSSFFTSEPAEALADELVGHEPGGLGYAYIVSGGSEAIEAALKMARQYFLEIGQPQRSRFIARRQSYHGNTLGALAAGGNAWRREPYKPLLADAFSHVTPAFAYHEKRADESDDGFVRRLIAELEAEIHQRLGPDTRRGLCGRAGRRREPPAACPRRRDISARCARSADRHGALLILDEVMSGMGRTGTLHAWEQEDIAPDIQAIAKGLGGGYQPIGATLASTRVVDAIRDGSGAFQHGHTYLGHPMACAAALAVQQVIRQDGLLRSRAPDGRSARAAPDRALRQSPSCRRHSRARAVTRHRKSSRTARARPHSIPRSRFMRASKRAALERGLACYPAGGTVDGRARRSCAARAAIHCERERDRHDSSTGWAPRSMPSSRMSHTDQEG